MADELVRVIRDDEARVNVTWQQQNGELPDPVYRDASEGDIKGFVTEAVRNGGIPGIQADLNADFRDFVVDRFPPTEARPYNLIQVRPKTAFGVADWRSSADRRGIDTGGSCICTRCGNAH